MTCLLSSLGVGALCLCSAMGGFSLTDKTPSNGVVPVDDSYIRVKELSCSSYLYGSSLTLNSSTSNAQGNKNTTFTWSSTSFPVVSHYNNDPFFIIFDEFISSSSFLHQESSFGSLCLGLYFDFSFATTNIANKPFTFLLYLQDVGNQFHRYDSFSFSSNKEGSYFITSSINDLDTSALSDQCRLIFDSSCSRDVYFTLYGLSVFTSDTTSSTFNWDTFYQGYYKQISTNYKTGYDAGYSKGETDAKTTYSGIANIVPNIFGSVVGFIDKVGSIEIFGVSLITILSIIVGGGLIALIVKLLLK